MFQTTCNKGFCLSFENGYTISVQFGPGNYSSHNNNRDFLEPSQVDKWSSKSAEIAVWHTESNDWVKLSEYDDVIGYLSADEVAKAIEVVSNMSEPEGVKIIRKINLSEML